MLQTSMECRNQTDSILMNLLTSSINNAHMKARSSTGPLECLNETSKFYELTIIQIDVGIKLVKEQPNHQTRDISRIKTITDLINLKHLLLEHLNSTKRLIIEKDKVLMGRLENDIVLKGEQSVMIDQMNSDIDMFKQRLDFPFEQIDQNKARYMDQQWRWLIEKETILIAMKGYIDDQSCVCFKKDVIIDKLMEERTISAFQTMIIEEHYMVLLNESYKDFDAYEIETKVKDDVFAYVFMEIANDMRIRFDFELQSIQNKILVVLKPLLIDFQENVNEKLHANLSRLDEIKKRVDLLSRLVISIRNEGVVYKKAFTRRCENLLLAETEVDLLGDQVEALQDLLQNIYIVLDQNSSILSHNIQVPDILKMIKRSLAG